MAKKRTRKKRTGSRKKTSTRRNKTPPRRWRKRLAYSLLAGTILFAMYATYLDFVIRDAFESNRWELPAHVYARPLELYQGLALSSDRFQRELRATDYRYVAAAQEPGTYVRDGDTFILTTRSMQFWDALERSKKIRVRITDGIITQLQAYPAGEELQLVRLDPAIIGGIYPAHNEDRVLVKYTDLPKLLIEMLLTIEDRNFYQHHGVDFKAIARALWANLRAGSAVQGGSTITQQLVKNYFLDNRRTLWRKANEALMALLLELHYDKNEILQAYANEVYLGQDKKRAIHGIALASQYYFGKQLNGLSIAEMASLITLVRGPSYYNPDTHPQRLLSRRNAILKILLDKKVIDKRSYLQARKAPLGIIEERRSANSRHPAFLELVKHQLRQFYQESDLTSEGLKIFTTLDPLIQSDLEQIMVHNIAALDRRKKLGGKLQGAGLLTSTTSGEVLALVGDKNPRYSGFNRALNALRPIGSLVKPAIYYTALADDDKYQWLNVIDDSHITLKSQDGKTWSPQNYDRRSHGMVSLIEALIYSYNHATVRLGIQLGFAPIVATLRELGVERDIPPYPSMLLGATELSPFEVAQMYQVFAADGFYSPLRAIREVLDVNNQPLSRYPIKVRQALNPLITKVLTSGLIQVMSRGTGRYAQNQLRRQYVVAGKTGTTNDTRDSWFAGYSAEHAGVVWLGTDDNQATGLTGSSGALKIWAELFATTPTRSIDLATSDEVEWFWVNPRSRKLADEGCEGAMPLAFIKGRAPTEVDTCAESGFRAKIKDTVNWLKALFE